MLRTSASLTFASLVLLLAGCGGEPASASARERGASGGKPKQVRTDRAIARPLGESVVVNGTLAAFDRATAGTKVAGRVQSIYVDLGSGVSRGQIIARIDPTDYQFRMQQAEASLAQARVRLGLSPQGSDDNVDVADTPPVREARALLEEARASRERYAALLKDGLVSKADYEQVLSSARVADSRYEDSLEEIRNRSAVMSQRRAEVSLARQQLADTAIYASFEGVVERRQASLGEFLPAGAPIAEIVRVNPLRFRAEVPERDAASIRIGQEVTLAVDGATGTYGGRVSRLSPTITERTRVLAMEADIPNNGSLRAGAFARASIVTNATSSALTVPTAAIIEFAGIQKVVLVEDGKAKEKPVTTGRKVGEWTEVLNGVKAGDEVVLNPVNIRSGQPLQTGR